MENVISEVRNIKRDVSKFGEEQLKCTVKFQALIETKWHDAQGEYVWDGDRSFNEACAIAKKRAEKDLTQKVKPSIITSEETMVCSDDPKVNPLKIAHPGDVVDINQLRAHPVYNKQFINESNGARCKLFIDSEWQSKDKTLITYQGVACKMSPDKWIVVDKF